MSEFNIIVEASPTLRREGCRYFYTLEIATDGKVYTADGYVTAGFDKDFVWTCGEKHTFLQRDLGAVIVRKRGELGAVVGRRTPNAPKAYIPYPVGDWRNFLKELGNAVGSVRDSIRVPEPTAEEVFAEAEGDAYPVAGAPIYIAKVFGSPRPVVAWQNADMTFDYAKDVDPCEELPEPIRKAAMRGFEQSFSEAWNIADR